MLLHAAQTALPPRQTSRAGGAGKGERTRPRDPGHTPRGMGRRRTWAALNVPPAAGTCAGYRGRSRRALATSSIARINCPPPSRSRGTGNTGCRCMLVGPCISRLSSQGNGHERRLMDLLVPPFGQDVAGPEFVETWDWWHLRETPISTDSLWTAAYDLRGHPTVMIAALRGIANEDTSG